MANIPRPSLAELEAYLKEFDEKEAAKAAAEEAAANEAEAADAENSVSEPVKVAPVENTESKPAEKNSKKAVKNKKSPLRTVWNIVTTVLVIAVVLLAIALVGVRLIGYTPYAVLSPSMSPTYNPGDLIYVKEVAPDSITEGDVITFVADKDSTVVTHRVDGVDRTERKFYTKGDANENRDGNPVLYENVLGVVQLSIPKLGYLNSDSVDNEDDPGNINTNNVWKVVNVNKGEIASDPGTPTRDGYTFAGWYFTRENDPGTEYDRANTSVNNNLVVYAKWNPDYVVHYYIEGTTTKVAPDKVVPNNAVGSVVSETAPDFAGCKFVGNSRDESITIKYNYKDNEIIFYYTKDADYTIKYYKDSVSDANYLGECTVTGTVDKVITVPAGSGIGQLDYKKPVGYKSGVLKDTNVKVKADNSSVVRVVYPADTVEYTVEAYIMGTDGQYPASPTKTEKKPDLTNKEVSAPTDTAYWVDDAEKDAFTFDSANENNVISGTVAGDNSTVLKVYISRNQYTLTWDVTKDDDTTYKVGDTTKYYYGQAVTEPKVEVPDYYDFDNWEKGGVDWPDTMPKNDVNISGELIRQRTDLVISKSGMEQGESAIFTVTGKGLGSGMKVIVPSGESVKIKNLPVGESYTITEQNDWSWKYEAHSSVTCTLTAGNTETVHFSNVPKLIKWLTDEFYVDNKFGIWR